MTDRIERLRSRIVGFGNEIRAEKMRITLESESKTLGWPNILRRAQSFYDVATQIEVHVNDDELIVGTPSSKPWALEIESCLGKWDQDELIALREDGYKVSKETEELVLELNKNFQPFGMYQYANLAVRADKQLENFVRTGICLAPWRADTGNNDNRVGGGSAASGLGLGPGWMLYIADYENAMKKGFEKMIEECDEQLDKHAFDGPKSVERSCTLQAMRLTLKGVIAYANRCADLAEQKAAAESDPVRRAELAEIAETCRRVPAKPPRSFREAIQFAWFIVMFISPSPTSTIGRFDQYMYPYYKADKDAGKITDEQVLELLDCFRVRCMEIHAVSGKEVRKRASGGARWLNMTIGGVKPDGSDATNELSYLILDAVMDCPCIQHTVTVRVAESTPKELIAKGVLCQSKGLSMPAFTSDKNYISFFTQKSRGDDGLPIEIARDYCLTGCIDGNIPGKTRTFGVSMFVAPLCLDIFLNQGKCKNTGVQAGHAVGDLDQFKTFDEFRDAFYNEFRYFIHLACEKNNIENLSFASLMPTPFRSALMSDGIEVGLDVGNRCFPFENGSDINAVGTVNLAQSLYAIKKIVYDEKLVTLSQLKEILDNNWAGHEDLLKKCKDLPHYGNDIDEVDAFVVDIYKKWNEYATEYPSSFGGYTRTNAISVTSHGPGGALTGATPDGRMAGETLADANASPIRGTDVEGPLAVFRSAMKIDQTKYQAFLFNMKFHPSALKTAEDQMKLVNAIRVYLTNGGSMIQFNVVDDKTLIAAKECPCDYQDLMVRVAGYSAYFVNLTENIQNELIERTSQKF
jgi:formate C-acetyltransferase